MKTSSVILLLSILLSGCNQKPTQTTAKSKPISMNGPIHLTDSNYAVLPFIKSEFAPFQNAKAASIYGPEIPLLERLINTAIGEYNLEAKGGLVIDDREYRVQLIAVLNEKGEKEVWVNCFCPGSIFKGWRKAIVEVDDGGSCFFNLKINLTTKEYYDLAVNGMA